VSAPTQPTDSDDADDRSPAADTTGFSPEDAEDALLEGDRTIAPGTARAALAYRTFRIVYTGSLLSNIGSWMQNVVLAAFAYDITRSAAVVSIVSFSQLGALLLLSLVGGWMADIFDRKRLLIMVAIEQMFFSVVLAWLARGSDPSVLWLVLVSFAIGIGQAIYAPTYSALLPILVHKRDLAGAVSLNSANMNLSRVIGPAIGGVAYAKVGASWVFLGNAVTYIFIIVALLMVTLPPVEVQTGSGGLRRVVEGFRVAAGDRVIGRCLTTMAIFSLLSLPFVVQMPVLAAENFGIEPKSGSYGFLYACFGLGAVIGALSIGTFLAGHSLETIVRLGLGGFAVALTTFALLRDPAPAYPMAIIVGFCYFATVTSLSTVLQKRLDDSVRGRVMAIWVMAFGGAVAVGGLIAGPIIDRTSVTAVVLFGAAVAAALIFFADLHDHPAAARSRSG
jgi:MFS family permease